jgi:hypothetical protein
MQYLRAAMYLWIGLTLPAVCQTITFNPVAKDVVLSRLHRTTRDNRDRATKLSSISNWQEVHWC